MTLARRLVPTGGASKDGMAGILSQGATAAASFAVQFVAAANLELAEYGVFAVLLAMSVGANALYVGFVCDGFAVFDRHDPANRAGLVTSAALVTGLCVVCAVLLCAVLTPERRWLPPVYAGLVVSRFLAETVRRIFVTRLDFGSLLRTDLCALVVTVLALAPATGGFDRARLAVLFGVMCCGALTTVLVGLVLLPRREWTRLRPGVRAFPTLFGFALWRALQAGLRPLSLLAARLLVAQLVSTAAVGALELARLVVAPVQVLINGCGSLLLGRMAARRRNGGENDPRALDGVGRSLGAAAAACGAASGVLAMGLGPVLLGKSPMVAVVLGWVVYQVSWAVGLPYVTELVTRRMSRRVFVIRGVDSVLGLGLATCVVLVTGEVTLLPLALAAGGLWTVLLARRAVVRPL
ncbi:hypothetical protein [Actinopolyspora mortivallis]|nr:hypothetical protein [Actinopolyspora mortivallis]